jgi:DNA-binding NarL/FixJ family response regulator
MQSSFDGSAAIRIAIVEDDEDLRLQLAQLIGSVSDLILVGQYGSPIVAKDEILLSRPDVVLMDINLPGMSGIECAGLLKRQLPATQIVMVTAYEDSDLIFRALMAGASGYLLKRTPSEKLIEAIREVHQGGSPMSSQIARRVVQYFNRQNSAASELERLSERELEVLESLSRGRLYKEIAGHLGVSLDTIRKHLQSVYQKLHVHNRTEAVVKFLRK